MDVVRTWGGKYFGWIEQGGLFARDGRHVGEFRKENVFGENGNYLGELREGRLIASEIKRETHSSVGFWPNHNTDGGPGTVPADETARDLPEGFVDFPEL
jgi:hypothetical protein